MVDYLPLKSGITDTMEEKTLRIKIRELVAQFRLVDPSGEYRIVLHSDDYDAVADDELRFASRCSTDDEVPRGNPIIKPVGRINA